MLPSGIGCCGEWAKTEADCPGGWSEGGDEERPGKGKQKKRGNISFVIMASLTLSTLQKDDGHWTDADSMDARE